MPNITKVVVNCSYAFESCLRLWPSPITSQLMQLPVSDVLLLLMSDYIHVYSCCQRFYLGKFVAGQNAKKICYLLAFSGQANALALQRINDECIFIDERVPAGHYTTINVMPSQLFSPALRKIARFIKNILLNFLRRFWSSRSLFGKLGSIYRGRRQ